MEQLGLLLRNSPQNDVSDDIILKSCKTFKDALRLCKSVSGLEEKQISMALGIDPGQWSRIWSGQGHFPEERIEEFMSLCGNLIPLRWLALKCGFDLVPQKSALELENERLRHRLEEQNREMEIAKRWMKEVGRQ